MILRYACLLRHPDVFLTVTGRRVAEFDALVCDLLPAHVPAERARLSRHDRRRALGGCGPFALSPRDWLLLVGWLRQYPTREVLGHLVDE